ncbi:2-C-methyl-D-erythritol 4-phosphate cytidylyltransferase [Thermodesulfobacteriota bacterium B35]
MERHQKTAVIIPAAGSGSRMGASVPKQFLSLAGEPLLVRTVRTFLLSPAIDLAVVVVPAAHREETRQILQRHLSPALSRRILFTVGGATRQDSVRSGLEALPAETDIVLVHDGARPLVSQDLILRCIAGAREHGAAIAAVAVKDTLKRVDGRGCIRATVDRSGLWQAQTPQAARRELLLRAHQQAAEKGFVGTDEAALLEHAEIPVRVVEGEEQNIKITRPGDMALAAGLLQREHSMKIGHGFDAHRLVEDRDLVLGGVRIDFELGLLGHSDADVLTHALIDAILGAVGAGDIGRHFPDSDQRYQGISSIKLLQETVSLAAEHGLQLANGDITIICQRPRLAPFLAAMRDTLAAACRVAQDRINIKATTTESMGYTGRGEGIAAHAVVLLQAISPGQSP